MLPQLSIYACIQKVGESEPTWLEGGCLIGRNPVVHPGDVQRVHAIGKPPADKFCAFRNIVNAVVLPSQGKRALASCLAGGDVDGDQFMIIQCESLIAVEHHQAGEYPPAGVRSLDRECTVEDVCDFIVEYIQSDVLGLLSVRHLIIAGESLPQYLSPLLSSPHRSITGTSFSAVSHYKSLISYRMGQKTLNVFT
jgi:RNA-dependent RNA polymerase